MDTQHCSDHSDQEAIAYCLTDGIYYCTSCFNNHNKHATTSIQGLKHSQKIKNKVSLIQETTTLIAKHKIATVSMLDNAKAYLDKKKKAWNRAMPEALAQCGLKGLEASRELKSKCIAEMEKLLSTMYKWTESRMNAMIHLAR